MIHVFIGTKAQYIKMAPLLRRMDAERVDYRLIDAGQHGDLTVGLRKELGLREPDLLLGGNTDVVSVPQALGWSFRLAAHLLSRTRLRNRVFGGHGGVCIVHGDTPSTLLSALLAKRAGLDVAHVEAGLRTFRWFHPFPEEIVRVLVGRIADLLFAPGPVAAANLRKTAVRGRIVEQPANTVLESVRDASGADWPPDERPRPQTGFDGASDEGTEAQTGFDGASDEETEAQTGFDGACDEETEAQTGADVGRAGSVLVTMHRVENLHNRSRREGLVDVVEGLASRWSVRWVMHGPTERALAREARARLSDAGVELLPLMAYGEFLANLAAASFVISDGGSIQEECALLGVPLLVWRDRSDRADGLGENVILSHYDPAIVRDFVRDPHRFRRPPRGLEFSPSAQILAELDGWR